MKSLFKWLLSIAVVIHSCSFFYAQLPSYLPASGLVAWYPFNGNANDESGNGNNGVVNGAVLATNRFGVANNAYSFNGSNTSIKAIANNLPIGSSSSTMSIWFSAAALPCGSSKAMLTYGTWSCNQARYIGFRGGCGGNLLTYAQFCNDINSSYTYQLNNWYHFVATSSGGSIKLYINAQLIGTYTLSAANTANGNIAIGCVPGTSNGDFFNGLLDDAAIWNRVLTEAEISSLYSRVPQYGGIPLFTNVPVGGIYSCDEGINFGLAEATAACNPVEITFTDDITPGSCPNSYTITRTWTATDTCGHSANAQTIYDVVDDTAPTFNNCPNDIQLPLHAAAPSVASVTATDNCASNPSISYSEILIDCALNVYNSNNLLTPARPLDNPCNYPYDWAMALFSLPSNYRWYQLDTNTPAEMVYNTNGTVTVTGRVFNVINPTGGFDFNVTYGNGKTWSQWTSDQTPSGFKADCGGEDANFGDWMYYILQPGAAVELTGWGSLAGSLLNLTHAPSNQYFGFQIGDGANNYNGDNGAGGWFNYSGVFLYEGQPVNSVQAGGIGDFAFELSPDESRCILRTWTATDDCGNTSTCTQNINFAATNNCNGVDVGTSCDDNNVCTVNDLIQSDCTCAGTIADSDQDGVCNADDLCFGPEPGMGCNDNNPCTVDDIVGVDCVCAGTLADDDNDNICNALDPCLGVPIAAHIPENLSLSCSQMIPDFNPEFYMADGSEVFLTHTASVVNEGCQTRVIEVWTATNRCNDAASVYRTITQTDNTAPVLSGIPEDRAIGCESADNMALVTPLATDDCNSTEISYTYERIDGDCPNNYTKHYVFTAVDACGNSSSEVYNVYVRDQIAPIIETYGIDGRQISCIGEIANRPFTATDNCSDVSLSYSMIDYMVGSFHIVETTCQAIDACGNTSYEVIVDSTALGNVGSPCNDGLYCTTNDVVTADCNCVGSLIDNNGNYICDFIDNFTISVNSLSFCPGETITLAVSQPITGLNYFWSNNATGTSIQVNPTQSTTFTVSTIIDVQSITASINLTAFQVNVFYADNDGDGYGDIQNSLTSCQETLAGYVMNSLDCDDSTNGLFPGSSCDDNAPCTVNDIVQSDCSCAGTFADADIDGTCDANDLCSEGPEPGSECNDRDDCTVDDMIQADCSCAGIYLDSDADGTCDAFDTCADGPEPGMTCDDGNPCTVNDAINGECGCVGTLSLPAIGEVSAFTCGSYAWNGSVYTTSGDYEYYTPAATGCDSLTILHLTVGTPTFSNQSVTNCGSYSWNGATYTQSGTYTYVTTNSTGCPKTETLNLTVNNPSTAASSVATSANNVNAGTSVTLTVQGGSLGTGASWKWYRGSCGGSLVGSGASLTVTANTTETYYVRAEGTCNTTSCVPVTVTVLSGQCGPELVSASSTRICSGSSTTLSVLGTLYPGAIWRWRKTSCSGTIVGTGANLLVSPAATTTYYVRAEGGTCGITLCMSITIIVDKMPSTPSVISGQTSGLCNAQNVTYSVTPVSTVQQYNWTVPPGITILSGQGTASVTVNVSNFINTNPTNGNPAICVTAQNACGISPIRCLSLTTYPATPASISGTAAPCINSVNTYSCPAVFGASSYTWQVPTGWVIQSGQGTASITVLCNGTSGNVRVRTNNSCGNSTQKSMAVAPKTCGTTAMPMQLELWPNPTSDRVFFAHGDATPDHLQIYDMLGRDVYNGGWVTEFDVSGLAGGIYFVLATSGGESVVKRMEVVR